MVHGTHTQENTNPSSFPITCYTLNVTPGDEMRTRNKRPLQMCASLVLVLAAGHRRVKSASTSLMWVGAAEHVAGRNKQGWISLRYATMETSGDVLGWSSFPPGGGREGGRPSPCPSREGRRWALSDCDESWMAGSMFDLCLRAAAEPDTFTQSV